MSGRGRKLPALLPGVGGPALGLTLAVLLLSLIGSTSLIGAVTGGRLLNAWAGRLAGSMTLVTAGGGLETPDAAAVRAAEILAHTAGITRAWVVDPTPEDAATAQVISPGLDSRGKPAESTTAASPPRLVAVTLAAGSPLTAAAVTHLLARQGLRVGVDDHGAWTGPVERAALIAGAGAASVLLVLLFILLGALWSLTAWGVRRAIGDHGDRITLLLHLGARDQTLSRPFINGFAASAALGAGLGTLISLASVGALIWRPELSIALVSRGLRLPELNAVDLAGGLAWPLLAAGFGVLAARSAARAALRRMG